MTPHAFGQKVANDILGDYGEQFKHMYGVDARLPHDYTALRQMLIAAGIGGGLGLARGAFWPGYHEKLDAQGNVIAKKRRSPWLGALEGAALGAGTSAISNYAGQTFANYTPEIDAALSNIKKTVEDTVPLDVTKKYEGVDVGKQLFDRIAGTV